jgi:hypothetical protein
VRFIVVFAIATFSNYLQIAAGHPEIEFPGIEVGVSFSRL